MDDVKASPESGGGADRRVRHRLGAHLSIAGGVHCALIQARKLRCDAVQIFVKNQRQWEASPLRAADIERWHELRQKWRFGPTIAHASYLINLAAPRRALALRSRRALANELLRCDVLAIPYLVVHPGSTAGRPRREAVVRVADSLNAVFARYPRLSTQLLLETTAGQGTALGATPEELAEIVARVEAAERVGVCADTCHVFVAGYDLRTVEGYCEWVELCARTVGLARVRCWHLNDSRHECGTRVDRHAHIGDGCLGRAAFAHLLGDPRFLHVPMILETPKGTDRRGQDMDRVNLRRLREIERRLAGAPHVGPAGVE